MTGRSHAAILRAVKSGTVLLLASLFLFACGGEGEPSRLRLATTTSTEDSGLLDAILPPFEAANDISVEVHGVGTGEALAIARRGDADIVLVHARKLEDGFVADGDGIDRHDLMYNDFVIAGPKGDPAGVKGMKDASKALAKIREAGATFVSRADNSGTHVREKALWEIAGGFEPWGGYLETGQGMGATLTVADEKRGYVLVDRGTWLARQDRLDLVVLVEGDPDLRNPYGVILVNPEKHPHVNAADAHKLLDYLVSPEGQKRIGDYRVGGEQLFHPTANPE